MKPKRKKCRQCLALFMPRNSMEAVCSVRCAILFAKTTKGEVHSIKAFKQETRALREKIKTKGQWMKEAQTAFNKYIRVRDKGLPCVSCDKPDNGNHQRHASHYRSVGACSALRLNTLNVHASCATCNSVKSGNLIEYRIRLAAKIGRVKVEWLECQNDITRYDIDYLKRIKKIFTSKARMLQERMP